MNDVDEVVQMRQAAKLLTEQLVLRGSFVKPLQGGRFIPRAALNAFSRARKSLFGLEKPLSRAERFTGSGDVFACISFFHFHDC